MSSDLLARLRLVRFTGIGPFTFRQVLMRFGIEQAALDLGGQIDRHAGGKVGLAAA